MNSKRYPEEFKIEAVKQITEKRCPVAEVAAREHTSILLCKDADYFAASYFCFQYSRHPSMHFEASSPV